MPLPTQYPAFITYAPDQATEDAIRAANPAPNGLIIVRTDLTPVNPPPPPPTNAVTVLDLIFTGAAVTDATGKPITSSGVVVANGKADMSNGYMTTPDHVDLNFGTGNFRITMDVELSVLSGGTHQFLMSKGVASNLNSAWYLMYEALNPNAGHLYWVTANNAVVIDVANSITNSALHRIELVKTNGVTTLLIDGVVKGTTSTSPVDTAGLLYIGKWNYQAGYAMKGLLSKCTITKG